MLRSYPPPLTLLLLLLGLLLLTVAPCQAHPQAPPQFYDHTPERPVRRAEARLTRLISATICKGRTGCRPPPAAHLRAATAQLQAAARIERIALGAQRPPFRTIVIEPLHGPALGTLLFLHSFNGSPEFIQKQLTPILRRGILAHVRIIVPQAYARPTAFFGTVDAPSWFDIPVSGIQFPKDQVFAAAANASKVLDTACRVLGRVRGDAVVAGESQGAALSLAMAMRHEVAAVGSLVGFLPAAEAFPAGLVQRAPRPPILMVNVIEDELVPIRLVRQVVKLLRMFGFRVRFQAVPDVTHNLGELREELYTRVLRFVGRNMKRLPQREAARTVIHESVEPVVWELL